MRIVSVNKLEEGMKVGKRVYCDEGIALLFEGVVLSELYIKKLVQKGIPCVYVDDDMSDGIEPTETIDPVLKMKAVQSVKTLMEDATPMKGVVPSKNKIYVSKRSMLDMRSIIIEMMEQLKGSKHSLVRIVEMMGTDMHMYTHAVTVATLTLMIGLELVKGATKFEVEEKLTALGTGALLHDIGMVMIDPTISNKADELTSKEMTEFKKHPVLGYNMIKDNPMVDAMRYGGIVKGCVLLHHENLDGSGYPLGWTAQKLQDYSRIIRVADAYAHMVESKFHDKRIPPYQALERLSAECYKLIDANVFNALRTRLALYPEGTGVLLNTGEKGIVTSNNETQSDRPIVKIVWNKEGEKHKGFKVIDMMEEMTYFIEDTVDV